MPFSFPSLPPSFLISDAAPPQALQHSPNLAQFRGTLAKDVMWNKDFQRTSTLYCVAKWDVSQEMERN